jgi:hypothetical protein
MPAVIVIGAKTSNVGTDFNAFQGVAYFAARDSKIYGNRGGAYVFVASVDSASKVSFKIDTYASNATNASKTTFWDAVSKSDRFMVASHCGPIDGPILDGSQPWGVQQPLANKLGTNGMLFWSRVGTNRNNKVRITLLGCNSGLSYAGMVNTAAQSICYGTNSSIAAANWGTAQPLLQQIEAGKTPAGMLRRG